MDLSGYHITFSDEFSTGSLDTSVWLTKYWWGGRTLPSNGEQQYFADSSTRIVKEYPQLDPFKFFNDLDGSDGYLSITANESPRTWWTDGLPYVSGMINTHGSFAQTYGYYEIRAQLPEGQGLWPAFWLLPESGNWPPEIDVLEFLGHDTSTYYVSSHWTQDGNHTFSTEAIKLDVDPTKDFYTYGMNWTADTIRFYFDGNLVATVSTPDSMHEPMYLLAGLAVGGHWPGSPDHSTTFPAEFKIDYIKVWAPDEPVIADAGQDDPLIPVINDDPVIPVAKDDPEISDADEEMSEIVATVMGTDGDDRLQGSGLDEIFWGGEGNDTFVFTTNPIGHATILDFNEGDLIEISRWLVGERNANQLLRRKISDNEDGDSVLRISDDDSITFLGVSTADLGRGDFDLI